MSSARSSLISAPGDSAPWWIRCMPQKTGAPGARWITGPKVGCGPCYRKSCGRGLACMDVTVDAVMELLWAGLKPGELP